MKIKVKLKFSGDDTGYIGQPFWPELSKLIDINKDVHPKLGEAKKAQALQASCEKRGITIEEYARLKEKAKHPFYTINDSYKGEIVIPQRVVQSFINHASMKAPKAVPSIKEKGLTFIGVKLVKGYLTTGKTVTDSKLFERFVKLEESNQRTFSSSAYIYNFNAEGTIILDEDIIKSQELQKLFEWGGKWIGLGGARPQGFGRFSVIEWEV